MLSLQHVGYRHPDGETLFSDISIHIDNGQKIALVGDNGSGKSTLLRIISGALPPSDGLVVTTARPYYIPQILGQFNHLSVAEALGVADRIRALRAILGGDVADAHFAALSDDWTIEDRCREALARWGLEDIDPDTEMASLSGGEKTKVFLAGIGIHQPGIVLLDEPSNHMDADARRRLYDFIRGFSGTLIVVSHDRELLRLPGAFFELSDGRMTAYGGDYAFYQARKQIEANALEQDLRSREKALRKARETERESVERQQKLDARGARKQEKAGVPTIAMNTLRNNAEKSTSKIKSVHAEKVSALTRELQDLRAALPEAESMRFGFDHTGLHRGKLLFGAYGINHAFEGKPLWSRDLSEEIRSGERISITGKNGSGKTTLLRMIMGVLEPASGEVYRADLKTVYIDQEYSLIDNGLRVCEQAQRFNRSGLEEHQVKIRLARFLFPAECWDKPCSSLSGGERMRLSLCCLTIGQQAPDLIVLDEPTNNLDIRNMEILTAAISDYDGTLIAVSHDKRFLEQIRITRELSL